MAVDGSGPLGVALMPGERVIYFYKPSYTTEKVMFIILGVLFLIVLIGIVFIILGLRVEKMNPRGQMVTTRRIVWVDGKGQVFSLPFEEAVDLEAEVQRSNANIGGGLVGALVGAAVSAAADAMRQRNAKTDPKFWARAIAVVVLTRAGQKFRIQSKDARNLGPFLAHCVFNPGSQEHAPNVPVAA